MRKSATQKLYGENLQRDVAARRLVELLKPPVDHYYCAEYIKQQYQDPKSRENLLLLWGLLEIASRSDLSFYGKVDALVSRLNASLHEAYLKGQLSKV